MPPWSLFTLCAVMFLDRFAFFGSQAALGLYLTESRGMDRVTAAYFLSGFGLLVHLSPPLGGILADRVLGQARAVLVGAAFLALGYALLVFHGSDTLYAAALASVAGQGLFRPAIAAVLAGRYPRLDPRRETAFVVFALVIQLGAFLSQFASGLAFLNFGPVGSFTLSAASMALAALVLLSGRRRRPQAQPLPEAAEPPARWSALLIIGLICALHKVATSLLSVSVPRFAVEHADLTLGGWLKSPISTDWVRWGEGAFQLLWAPLVFLGLIALRRRAQPAGVAKLGIGMVLTVLPCLLMVRASMGAASGAQVSLLWVLGAYLAAALPGLFLVPIAMALGSQLVPRRHLGTFFGVWFALSSVIDLAAGRLSVMQTSVSLPAWYGGLCLLALIAAGLWISQVRRLEAALSS